MRLKDKVILVTGATTGIGAGMAGRFAAEGARVVVHGIEGEPARAKAQALSQGGTTCLGIGGDLSDPDVPPILVARTLETYGRIDAVVNNAGISERSNLETTDAATFDRILAINVRAPLLLIRAALPHFRRQSGGRVVNIGSVNAYCGERNLLAYSISKGSLMTLTRNLADAHGAEGIRVNQLNVGWTLTENERELKKRDGMPDDWPEHLSPVFAPSGRLLSPDDIAWAAVYLLSDEAALLNGAIIDLNQYPMIGRNPHKE